MKTIKQHFRFLNKIKDKDLKELIKIVGQRSVYSGLAAREIAQRICKN